MTDRWDVLIRKASKKWRVDFNLIKAVIWQESAGKADAKSHCGACGLMQIMPATAGDLGLDLNKIFDPWRNIDAGTMFLRDLFGKFPEIPGLAERWKYALASYNGGRGHINRALRASRRSEQKRWWLWEYAKKFLTRCRTQEIIFYVDGILTKYMDLTYSDPGRRATHGVARLIAQILPKPKGNSGIA